MKYIIKISILIFITVLILSSHVFAVSNILSMADNAIETGKDQAGDTVDTGKLINISDTIYNIFLGVGTGIAIIVGAILGIQFMTAGVDKKVEVKEALVPYVISCIVIFGSFGIWKLVVTILNSVT